MEKLVLPELEYPVRDPERLRVLSNHFRMAILIMLNRAGSGHTGGSLSAIDIMTTLYLGVMRVKPGDPGWEKRDIFLLSKGHAAPALYVILAYLGYFPVEDLLTLRKIDSHLQGHPSTSTPGVEAPTGSLGQGLSIAKGMALASRVNKKLSDRRVFVLLGDGECQEGQIWEAAMSAAHYRLDNLYAFVDYNNLQIDGWVSEVKDVAPLSEKWRAFGWEVREIDGHDHRKILETMDELSGIEGKPKMVVAKTVKGKGVSIFEDQVKYHGVAPSDDELKIALEELKEAV